MKELREIIPVSHYSNRPVERKKIAFILSAITRIAREEGRKVEDLSVLEVACGQGGVTLPVARLGCTVRAFDIDAEEVAILNSRAGELGMQNITATVDDGYDYADGKTYDIVIASEVLEHLVDPSKLAGNIQRHMRDGSHLIVTVPNGYGPWETRNRLGITIRIRKSNLLRRLMRKPLYVKRPGRDHCQHYTRKRLCKIMAGHAFHPVWSGKSNSILGMFGRLMDNQFFGELDTRLADILPYWLASGWYFVFELRGADRDGAGTEVC